jgi:hypothetical protein
VTPLGQSRPQRTGEGRPRYQGNPGTVRTATTADARFVAVVLGAIIGLQRLALPFGGGQIPIILPVVLAAVAWGVHLGFLHAEPVRRQLYLVALLCCVMATTIACWRGMTWSPLSIIYLAATYVPFTFHLREPSSERYEAGLALFLRLMTLAAVVGILQVGVQLVGVQYTDVFSVLPKAFVLQGYHTSYPVAYGSNIFKANGMVFLEPSFFSQFLALALVVHIHLRRRGAGAYLLMAGIVASVSGTGIILAIAGILALGVIERRRQVARMAAGVLFVAVLVAVSPAGSIFTSRIDESASSTSSAQGRFTVPYSLSASRIAADPVTLLTGRGPGAAERISKQLEATSGVTAVFPVIPKVAVEYGVPALVLFLAFIFVGALRSVPSLPIALTALVMYFALSGSFLQPVTVYTMYALTSLFAADRRRPGPPVPVPAPTGIAARRS